MKRFSLHTTTNSHNSKVWSSRKDFEVVRLVSDLLIAATDTTSITATWLLYILSQHQHIQVIDI